MRLGVVLQHYHSHIRVIQLQELRRERMEERGYYYHSYSLIQLQEWRKKELQEELRGIQLWDNKYTYGREGMILSSVQ